MIDSIKHKVYAFFIIFFIVIFALGVLFSPYGLYVIVLTLLSIPIKNKKFRKYVWTLWVSNDQTINATLYGNMDLTMSRRVGYLAKRGQPTAIELEKFIDWLFWKGHCREAIEKDEEVKH